MFKILFIVVVTSLVCTPALAQFNWVLSSKQSGTTKVHTIPSEGRKDFQDLNGRLCIFAFKSKKKIGKRYTEYLAKFSCKKGGSRSSNEYTCLYSELDAEPEVVKIEAKKSKGGFGLQNVTIPGADKKDLKGFKITTGSGAILEPNEKGEFVQSSREYRPRWNSQGEQLVSTSTSVFNGLKTKTTLHCTKTN